MMDEEKINADFEVFEEESLRRERRYALLQAAAVIATDPKERCKVEVCVDIAESLLAEVERREK